jgi:hypothetical protein
MKRPLRWRMKPSDGSRYRARTSYELRRGETVYAIAAESNSRNTNGDSLWYFYTMGVGFSAQINTAHRPAALEDVKAEAEKFTRDALSTGALSIDDVAISQDKRQ